MLLFNIWGVWQSGRSASTSGNYTNFFFLNIFRFFYTNLRKISYRVYHKEMIHIFINFFVSRYISWWLYHISWYAVYRFTPTGNMPHYFNIITIDALTLNNAMPCLSIGPDTCRQTIQKFTCSTGRKLWHISWIRAHFLSLAWSKLRLCSANHRPGYWSNLPCDWPSTAWAYSKQETENGPRKQP